MADAYGHWVDRFYLSLGLLLLPIATGDLVTWMISGAPVGLVGPAAMLALCIAYLRLRRRFRRSGLGGTGGGGVAAVPYPSVPVRSGAWRGTPHRGTPNRR